MSEFSYPPSPEDILGGEFLADWQKRYDELEERAANIDLNEYLSKNDLSRIQEELTGLGIEDPDQLLRMHTVKFADEAETFEEPIEFTNYIDQLVASLKDTRAI
jgi:hypothetical protein